MYLEKRTYVKNWNHEKSAEKYSVTVKKGGKVLKIIDPKRVSGIIEDVGYWRKANAIHAWFVKNCQDGNDDCRQYRVDAGELRKLLEICKQVFSASKLVDGKIKNGQKSDGKGGMEDVIVDGKFIEDPTVAKELLPTVSGFFFGSYEYDEYYLQDVKDTILMLESVLKVEGDDYYYSSSW